MCNAHICVYAHVCISRHVFMDVCVGMCARVYGHVYIGVYILAC